MIQVNTLANLNSGLSVTTGMVIGFIPLLGNTTPNEDSTKVILPLEIQCYVSDSLQNDGYAKVIPLKDGEEAIKSRQLEFISIEYTNTEWSSDTGVNKSSMETRLIAALEVWNPAWKGNLVKV